MMKATFCLFFVLVLHASTSSALEGVDADTEKFKSTPRPSSPVFVGRQVEGSPTVSPSTTTSSGPSVSNDPTVTISPTKSTGFENNSSLIPSVVPSTNEQSTTSSPTTTSGPSASKNPIVTISPTTSTGFENDSSLIPSSVPSVNGQTTSSPMPTTTSPSTTGNPSIFPSPTRGPMATSGPTERNEQTPTSTEDLGIQTPPDGTECWGNLTEILMDQRKYSFRDTVVKRTYIVCPNKIYETGATDQNGMFDPNYHAMLGMRRNVEYRCGADGASSNNCIIRGIDSFGEVSLMGLPDMFVTTCSSTDSPSSGNCDFIVDNFTFRGFTLEDSTISAIFVIAQVGNNVLFDDIVLRDAPMWSHIFISKYGVAEENGGRELADGSFLARHDTIPPDLANRWPWNFRARHAQRRLQEEEEDYNLDYSQYLFDLTITNSKFINNTILQCGRFLQCEDGTPNYNFLISSDNTHTPINVHNSIFENNDLSQPVNTQTLEYDWSHLIAVDWNSSITNNTFINNTVTSSLIRMFDDTIDQTLTLADNYVEKSVVMTEKDDGIDCTFALIGGIGNIKNATCVEAERSGDTAQPTTAPTMEPPSRAMPSTPMPQSTILYLEPGFTYLPTGVPSLQPPTTSDAATRRMASLDNVLFIWTGTLILMLHTLWP